MTTMSALTGSIQTALQQARAVSQTIQGHAAKTLPEKGRQQYLAALAMVGWVDGALSDAEGSQLAAIARSLELSELALNVARQHGQAPSPELLAELLEHLLNQELRFLFAFEMMLVALADGTMHPLEQELVGEVMELLRLREQEVDWLAAMAFGFAMRDGAQLRLAERTAASLGISFGMFQAYLSLIELQTIDLGSITVAEGEERVISRDTRLTHGLVVEKGGTLRIQNAHITFDEAAQIQVKGKLFVDGATLEGSERGQAGYLILAHSASRISVTSSRIVGVKRPGLGLVDCSNILIWNCTFESCENHLTDSGWAIDINNPRSYSLVEEVMRFSQDMNALTIETPVIQDCSFISCGQEVDKPVIAIVLSMLTKGLEGVSCKPVFKIVKNCTFGFQKPARAIRAKVKTATKEYEISVVN